MALGVNSPRHLSGGSLPLSGPQSLSLMVHWGAPNCPGCGGGEGTDQPENDLEERTESPTLPRRSLEAQGPGQVRRSLGCAAACALAPGQVTARSLCGLAAHARALPRALPGG